MTLARKTKPAATSLPSRGHAADYFGAPYRTVYEDLLVPRPQTEAEADFLLRQLKPRRNALWLDLPCGYGRHLRALRKRRGALRLAGGDLNLDYLRAPGIARAANVARLNLLRLPFASGCADAVLNLLNSFGYFGDAGDAAVLAEFARVLRPRGWLVLDVANRRALLNLVRRQPAIRYSIDGHTATEFFRWDAEHQQMLNRTEWRIDGKLTRAGYRLRLYTLTEMRRMLAGAGFTLERIFGDFSGEPFTPASDRLLLIARRR